MVAVMLWLLAGGTAQADPVALRAGEGPTLLVGSPVTSVSAPVSADWSVVASYRWRSSVELAVGHQQRWVSEKGDRGWAAGASGGAVLPLWDPALALSVSGYGHRWREAGETTLRGGLAVPVVARLTGGAAVRLPLTAELLVAHPVGPVSVGVYGGGGVVLSPGAGWALGGQTGVVVSGPRR